LNSTLHRYTVPRIIFAVLIPRLSGLILIHKTPVPGISQTNIKIQLENKLPKHLPIKAKIRSEKENAFKDLNNDRWYRDLEIEVKNTGERPIFSIVLILELPEIQPGGRGLVFDIRYGDHSIFDSSKGMATPGDIPINPGETHVFKISETEASAWDHGSKSWPKPTKVVLQFEQLSFGDGTGFWGTAGAPWPNKTNRKPNLGARSRLTNRIVHLTIQV